MKESLPAERRIGIIGGSFDPVHIGHLIIAQDAAEYLDLTEVIFIPAAIPPHKQQLQRVDAGCRLNMLKLATESDPRFSVSDIETKRGGVSYTVDTLNNFHDVDRDVELFLIVGSDTLVDLHTWHKIEEILELCNVATFLRPGEDAVEVIEKKIKLPAEQKERLLRNVINAHRIEVSSSEIRTRLAEGRSIRYLVPPDVEMYIYEQGLYQGREG
jgi:nicotinate-nucleotide adenylyltransferase